MLNYHKLIDPDPDPGSARPHCWDPPSDGCVKLTDFWGVYIYICGSHSTQALMSGNGRRADAPLNGPWPSF